LITQARATAKVHLISELSHNYDSLNSEYSGLTLTIRLSILSHWTRCRINRTCPTVSIFSAWSRILERVADQIVGNVRAIS